MSKPQGISTYKTYKMAGSRTIPPDKGAGISRISNDLAFLNPTNFFPRNLLDDIV